MAFTTIQELNETLGITDNSQQNALEHLLRRAVAKIRAKTKRFQGGIIQHISVASPTVVRSIGHGLSTGDVIKINGSDSTPSLDGTQTVTVVDKDSFTIAENVTAAGSCGTYGKRFTEFYSGEGHEELFLRERPVQEIESLWLDQDGYFGDGSSPFATADLLVAGTDYALAHDGDGLCRSGKVVRLNGRWPLRSTRTTGLTQGGAARAFGNIKVQYIGGWLDFPLDLQTAAESFVVELQRSIASGGPMQSESLDYYSYTRISAADEAKVLSSISSLLAPYTTWVF